MVARMQNALFRKVEKRAKVLTKKRNEPPTRVPMANTPFRPVQQNTFPLLPIPQPAAPVLHPKKRWWEGTTYTQSPLEQMNRQFQQRLRRGQF